MQISIVGTHGAGKTTVLSRLHNLLDAERCPYVMVKEVARHCPFPIGETSSKQSQDWIIGTQKYFEDNCAKMCYPVITDRNMIDQYAYYTYWVGENKAIEEELIIRYINRNNHILLMPANPDYLVADGVCPICVKFQEEIHTIILRIVDKLGSYDSCKCNTFHFLNDNSIDTIVDLVRNYVSEGHASRTITNAEYVYKNEIFKEIVSLHNFSPDNLSPEYFDSVFYSEIIQHKRK